MLSSNKEEKRTDIFIYLTVYNSSNLGHLMEIKVLWEGLKDSRVNCSSNTPGDGNLQLKLRITVLENQERIQRRWQSKNILVRSDCISEAVELKNIEF